MMFHAGIKAAQIVLCDSVGIVGSVAGLRTFVRDRRNLFLKDSADARTAARRGPYNEGVLWALPFEGS